MSRSSSPVEQFFGLIFSAAAVIAASVALLYRLHKARKARDAQTDQGDRPAC